MLIYVDSFWIRAELILTRVRPVLIRVDSRRFLLTGVELMKIRVRLLFIPVESH